MCEVLAVILTVAYFLYPKKRIDKDPTYGDEWLKKPDEEYPDTTFLFR